MKEDSGERAVSEERCLIHSLNLEAGLSEAPLYTTQPLLKHQVNFYASNEQRALKPQDILESRLKAFSINSHQLVENPPRSAKHLPTNHESFSSEPSEEQAPYTTIDHNVLRMT